MEPATSNSAGGGGVPGGSDRMISSIVGVRSANVTYFVAFTNSRNSAFVTV
jgi:hypothetical protein